jgi:hypothetical protein
LRWVADFSQPLRAPDGEHPEMARDGMEKLDLHQSFDPLPPAAPASGR